MKKDSRAKTKSVMLLALLLLSITIVSCGTDTPLAEYTPSSDQEVAVKNVLLGFEDGVNRRDVKKVAGLIHEDARLMLGRERARFQKRITLKFFLNGWQTNRPSH